MQMEMQKYFCKPQAVAVGTSYHPKDLLSAFATAPAQQFPVAQSLSEWAATNNVPNVKEATMNTNAPNAELVKRDFLDTQLWHVKARKDIDMGKHYGLSDDEHPRTFKEFIERIKAGKFVQVKNNVLDDEYEYEYDDAPDDSFSPDYPTANVRWRDPKVKEDKKGHREALARVDEAYRKAKREIMILDLDKALVALDKFDEKKFH